MPPICHACTTRSTVSSLSLRLTLLPYVLINACAIHAIVDGAYGPDHVPPHHPPSRPYLYTYSSLTFVSFLLFFLFFCLRVYDGQLWDQTNYLIPFFKLCLFDCFVIFFRVIDRISHPKENVFIFSF